MNAGAIAVALDDCAREGNALAPQYREACGRIEHLMAALSGEETGES